MNSIEIILQLLILLSATTLGSLISLKLYDHYNMSDK